MNKNTTLKRGDTVRFMTVKYGWVYGRVAQAFNTWADIYALGTMFDITNDHLQKVRV